MEKKRKTDLFRFAKLRAPQLLNKERRKLGFVEHPDTEKSKFLQQLDPTDDVEISRTKVAQVAGTFSPLNSVEEVKQLSQTVWDFSLWLAKNKSNIVRSELDAKIPTPSLSAAQLIQLWDNVHYDILSEKNPYVRQACLQMIVAQNFIDAYKSYSPGTTTDSDEAARELADLKRLANARILVDRAFTQAKLSYSASANSHSSRTARRQEAQHQAKFAKQMIPVLEGVKKEFEALDKRYTKDFNRAFDEAFAQYETLVNRAIQTYLSQHPELKDRQDAESQIPDDLIADFDFTFAAPLSSEYTKGKLSDTTTKYVQENCLEEEAMDGAINYVCSDIAKTLQGASKEVQKQFSHISVNGVPIRPNSSVNHDFALSFEQPRLKTTRGTQKDIFFSLSTGYNNAFIENGKFTLTVGGVEVPLGEPQILSAKNKTIFMQLTQNAVALAKGKSFEFEAEFTLDNGKTLSIRKKGNTSNAITSGVAVLIALKGKEVPLYGINRIGVADYLKVEQELCCYISGEVSHIENILAREYKERSTRSLTRTETSSEFTTEHETEDSTDTTTTSRHEMSTEVAEVLERDRSANVGFDTGTNGKYGAVEFNASAFGDFSFGQSTSNSNTIARNYAEDVTRRALERIVQKTTAKRTSKILKEFEDTNKHGYDNRSGDKHVTGVFRWIDKVYKNRIVNYGRRLIYEFMVPEPARFYKDAIILQASEEDTNPDSGTEETTVLVKPTHPSEHGITDASTITRDRYSHFASLYGVTPDAPQDAETNAHGSYSESIGSGDSPHSFNSYSPIQVPIGYECHEIRGAVNYNYKARVGAKAYIKIATGGKNWQETNLRGTGNVSRNFTHTNLSIGTAINVSVNTKKITAFTLSIDAKCRLKANIFEQWQQDVFNAIMEAYNRQLQAYNDALAAEEAANEAAGAIEEDSTLATNPKFNAQVINTELKRLCIEMLTKPFGIPQGKDFYQEGECEVPEIKLGKDLDIYSSHVKFFEQAFDWNLMSQLFYPYYWAKKCDWKSLFQSQASNDHIFQAFLQSGMGRIMVPVREGFEDAVAFFMETGQIWNGNGIVIDTDDELYLSIVDEMTYTEGVIEGEEWETIVPSSLTIVQARSAMLDDESLPCCESDEDVLEALLIKKDENILGLKPE